MTMVASSIDITLTAVDYDPFVGPELVRLVAITEPQAEIWMACLIGGDDANRAYNESVGLRLRGQFNKSALEQAIPELIRRHEALRCAFSPDGKQICIFREVPIKLVYIDATIDRHTDPEEQLRQYVRQDALHVFDLVQGPLFKVGLIRFSDTEYHLVLTAHHIICDGWSMGILMQDLSKLYSAFASYGVADLPPAGSLSDFADEQLQFAASQPYQEIEQFWINQYKNGVPLLDLSADFPRPKLRTYKSSRLDYTLDQGLVQGLKKVGVQTGASFVTTLTAAFEVFLYRLTGQRDLVLGLPAAGQLATGHYRLIGHCVNLLPLRSHIEPQETFGEFLGRRKQECLDAFDHQRLTFGSLLKKLALARDMSRVPLVPVVLNMDMGLADGVDFYGLTYELVSNPREYENFDLFVNATGSSDSLVLEWSYNTQLFRSETIDRMMVEFKQLLISLVNDPTRRIGSVEQLANPLEIIEHYRSLNNTRQDYPATKLLHQLIAEQARVTPDKIALSFGTKRISYRELNARANQFAQYLIAQQVKPGDKIGFLVSRSDAMVIAMLGMMKCGAIYLPLDPTYPVDRITFVLNDSMASLLILSNDQVGLLQTGIDTISLEEALSLSANLTDAEPTVVTDIDHIIHILYTSGSTGRPKGVPITHRNLLNFLLSMLHEPGMTAQDRLLAITTIAFDISGLELYLPLLCGAEIVLVDAVTARDGYALLKLVEREKITFLQATPATWRMMLAAGWVRKFPLKALCGGEALHTELAASLLKRCDSLWNMYGPTEATVWASLKQIRLSDEVITVGRPIPNMQLYVLDENGQPVDVGVVGEIFIGGVGVATGYQNRPELTAERFVSNPFDTSPTATMYRTGDLGRLLASGEVQCLGRTDHQVKVRGYRIELGEIENTLTAFDDVKDAVVVVRQDQIGDERLVAYVVPETGASDDEKPYWQDRWNLLYDLGRTYENKLDQPEHNVDAALHSQLSGRDDIRHQVNDWLQESIKRIRPLQPRRVMEVGCGAGQVLFALAPEVDSYIATDYAQTAIDVLDKAIAERPGNWNHVSTKTALADDYSMVAEKSLDLVIIHSVAQYFPDGPYFLRVIEEAAKAIASGGCIFLGDMQARSVLRMQHAADQLQQSPDTMTVGQFRHLVDKRVLNEHETVTDPSFFYLLPQLIPAIKAVNVQIRNGGYLNEGTRYRYDAWLYVDNAPPVVSADVVIDWKPDHTLQLIEQQLAQRPGQVVEFRRLVNQRTILEYKLVQLIDQLSDTTTLNVLRGQLQETLPAIDPSELWAMATRYKREAHIRWSTDGHDNLFDVVFIPNERGHVIPARPVLLPMHEAITSYVRSPFKAEEKVSPEQVQRWKQQAGLTLPPYMVPTQFVTLAKLPLTPNGKVDRKALPEPTADEVATRPTWVGPRTDTEKLVADIWAEYLKVDRISIFDNFFEIGGYSLIAVQIMGRIEKETGKRLPLATLFEHSTIEKLALMLHMDSKPVTWDSLVPIKPQGTKMPLYIIHGAGLHVLLFNALAVNMDPDQPVYGLQAKGINGIDEPLDNIEDIAAYYIESIRANNPDGPYALAGYSFGGIIAFEMVRQLTAMGKEVKLLAMFDTYAEQSHDHDPWPVRVWEASRIFVRKFLYTFVLLARDPRQTIDYKIDINTRRLKELYWKIWYGEEQHKAFRDTSYRVDKSNRRAWRNYRLTPQPVKIELFRAKIRTYYLDDFEFLGWKPFALKGVNVHEVPGDHNYLFASPNDKEFGRILQNVLDNC